MVDNIAVTPGSGASVAADEVGGVLYQRVKMTYGPDGTASDVSPANPMPISISAQYEAVAASQTAQVLGGSGATGDVLQGLLVVPTSTSPGVVTILDNSTSITVFAGGSSSISNLVPFFIPLGIKSVSGAWKVTTGSGLSVIAVGSFT